MSAIDLQKVAHLWPNLSDTLFIPHTEAEYNRLRDMLDELIDEVGEDEAHPLASLMELIGLLIEHYENVPRPILLESESPEERERRLAVRRALTIEAFQMAYEDHQRLKRQEELEDAKIAKQSLNELKAAGGDRKKAGWLEWNEVEEAIADSDFLQDELAVFVARVMTAANKRAVELGIDVRQSIVTITQMTDGEPRWRVKYGAEAYIGRRGGDLIVDVDAIDTSIKQVLRGQ